MKTHTHTGYRPKSREFHGTDAHCGQEATACESKSEGDLQVGDRIQRAPAQCSRGVQAACELLDEKEKREEREGVLWVAIT